MGPNPKVDPPSSFPRIYKYPTERDIPFRTALEWMAGKKIDDSIGDLWRVHEKLYNLEPFAKLHPGGEDWIRMTKGTDITEAFEVSHVVNTKYVDKVLEKYFVVNAKHPRNSPYTFEEKGFFKTLKRKVEPILKEVGTGPTKNILLMQDSLGIGFAILGILGAWLDSRVLLIAAGVVLAMCTIGAHNFFHIKDNWRKYYFDLSFLSSYEWRITHALSHHMYPNTIMDAEVSFFEPLLEFFPSRQKSWLQRYGPIVYLQAISCLLYHAEFLKRWAGIIMGKHNLRPENLIIIAQLTIFLIISPSLWAGYTSWFLMQTASSYWFLFIGINAAHHHPDCFHEGDEARSDADFGLAQMDAVRDRAEEIFNKSLFVTLTTFGEHTLHHLFPTICHSKLIHIRGVFQETLKEFREEFPPVPQWELYKGTLKQLKRIEPNSFKKHTSKRN